MNLKTRSGVFLWIIFSFFLLTLQEQEATKPFMNEFFFKLADEKLLSSVQTMALDFNFAWQRRVVPRLHNFKKSDIPETNKEATPEEEISSWVNAFENSVEYIVQDHYTQVYPVSDRDRTPLTVKQIPLNEEYNTTGPTKALQKSCPLTDGDCKNSEAHSDECTPIRIAVLDAFFDTNHRNLQCTIITDLARNFIDGSKNLNPKEGFPDSYSNEEEFEIYNHGTMCMGRITSSADYGCNEGGDTGARIVPLKFIDSDGKTNDEHVIQALKYLSDGIDIYSCSFGQRDNSGFPLRKYVHIEDTIAKGVSEGRNCKGSIYLFPSGNGNGFRKLDNCNTDVFANSINTITIASISMSFKVPDYIETCPCALVATFGNPDPSKHLYMNTTITKNHCTSSFEGTSAATAYAASMISHALKTNSNLTKRDIEHMLIQTADKGFVSSNIKWQKNGAGFMFNDKIGFGAINLTALKLAAKTWKHVPTKHVCVIDTKSLSEVYQNENKTEYRFKSDSCHNTRDYIQNLEHVQVRVTISCSNVSNINLNLISPAGTKVGLLTTITVEKPGEVKYEHMQWTFMTVHFWGENPDGQWKFEISDDGNKSNKSEINLQKLILHGTASLSDGFHLDCPKTSIENNIGTTDFETPNNSAIKIVIPFVGTVIVVTAIFVFVWCCCRRKRNKCCYPFKNNNGRTSRNGYSAAPNKDALNL